jgi:hypothetical protein
MDCVQSYELFCCAFFSRFLAFNFIFFSRTRGWGWKRDIAPRRERTLCVYQRKLPSRTENFSLPTFLIFYCLVRNKKSCIKEKNSVIKWGKCAIEITKISFGVFCFDRLRASLAQIKSNLLTLLTFNLCCADERKKEEYVNTHHLITKSSKRN